MKKVVIPLLIVLVLAVILPASAMAFTYCNSVEDCGAPSCIGSIRGCENRHCTYTQCLFSGGSNPNEDQDNSDYEHYSEIVGLRTAESETTAAKGIMAKLGALRSFKSMHMSMIMVLIAVILLASAAFTKRSQTTKMIICILAIAIIMGASIQIGLNVFVRDPATLWKRTSAQDFTHKSITKAYEEFVYSDEIKASISPLLVDARQFRKIKDETENTITILEFENISDVETWKIKKGLSFTRDSILGESVFSTDVATEGSRSPKRVHLWDEDRFVFVAAGNPARNREAAIGVVKKYPYKSPGFLSRLMIEDASPPEFFNLIPDHNSAAINNIIKFTVADDLNLEKDSIKVEGVPGFKTKYCDQDPNNGDMICEFETNFNPGFNQYTLIASDKSGNLATKDVLIYMDLTPPTIVNITPTLGAFTNNSKVAFEIEDDFSMDRNNIQLAGLEGFQDGKTDCYYLNRTNLNCVFISEPIEGANNFKIFATDSAGNEVNKDHFFNFLSAPKLEFVQPLPDSYTNNKKVSFIVKDSSGIEQKQILVSHKNMYEDIIADCLMFGHGFQINYNCQKEFDMDYGGNTITISIIDMQGTVYKVPLNFIYDNMPPVIKNLEVEADSMSAYISFNISDVRAGVNIDSFNLVDLKVFNMDMDCTETNGEKAYSCYIEFLEISTGKHSFDIYIEDKAGNSDTQKIEFEIA